MIGRLMLASGAAVLALGLGLATAAAQMPADVPQIEALHPTSPAILPLRDRAKLHDKWLADRLDTVVTALMREQGIDMWVLIAREYMEDPVVQTMLDGESLHARRRTILVFYDPGAGKPIERLTVSRYGLGGLFAPAWSPEKLPDQWQGLAEVIAKRNPRRIAVNVSTELALADGMTHSQFEGLKAALPEAMRARIFPTEELAIGWLETRTPAEMAVYPQIVRIAHTIIAEALSNEVITPGKTTAADVEWWYRERIAGMKLDTWFHPSIGIFRNGAKGELSGDAVIMPGDLVWTDFGITYLGLNTDTQHMAYVLKPGETAPPQGLVAGMAAANGVQDALTSSFRTGLSGNEILAAARAKAIAAGYSPSIYSHPIGYHGHAAGAAIGFWDDQAGSPRGAHRLRPNTAWSIELSATVAVPEWGGRKIPFRLEEDAFFDGQSVRFIDGRQKDFHLIAAE